MCVQLLHVSSQTIGAAGISGVKGQLRRVCGKGVGNALIRRGGGPYHGAQRAEQLLVEQIVLTLGAEIGIDLRALGAELLHCEESEVVFDGKTLSVDADPTKKVSLSEVAFASQFGHMVPLEVTETHTSPLSPPPYMVGAAEIELDKETGEVKVVDYAACVDCGTPINPNLTRVQAEGGLLQGIGMALTENITYDSRGWPMENSFMQYKIPTRVDIGHIRVEFESSYEPNGPFGAKSIGEVVINTPLPAIADAVYNAIGTRFYELPITPEQIAMAVEETS